MPRKKGEPNLMNDGPAKPRKLELQVEDFVPDICKASELEPVPLPKVPLDGREPVAPGVPPQTGKKRFVSSELWVIVRCCAEGRRLGLETLSALTGIHIDSINSRADREAWWTPERVKRENLKKIDKVLDGVFEGVVGFVNEMGDADKLAASRALNNPKDLVKEAKATGEYADASLIDCNDECEFEGGVDLREFISTPKKFRPKAHELLPSTPMTAKDRLQQIKNLQFDLKSELSKRADIHQMAQSEITQTTLLHLMQKVHEDPSLGILFANELEKIDKVARRNFKLDVPVGDPLAGARTVVMMSDPTFIPKPAIVKVVDAEEVGDSNDDTGYEPETPGVVEQEQYEEGFRVE